MISRRLIVLASLALVSLFATGWISDHSSRVMARSVDWLDHTRDVLLSLDQFGGAIAESESNARGYVITETVDYVVRFELGAQSLQQSLARLKTLAANDPQLQKTLSTLDALSSRRLELLRALIGLKNRHASQEELSRNVASGTSLSQSVGQVLTEIRAHERQHFQQQLSKAAWARTYAIYGPWATCVIAAIMFGVMLAQVIATLNRQHELRTELLRTAHVEHDALQRAKEADQMKDHFLATVSHELRTPLTSILGWCQLLETRKSATPELLDEGITTISEAARIQSQLVEDLLDVSRAVAGRLRLRTGNVNLNDVIDHAIASVATSAQAKGITIRKSPAEQTGTFRGDPVRLQQVVWNLLSNSIKFTPPNGEIDIGLRSAGDNIEIVVRDNGEGIPPDLLPHVFDPFRQGQATGSRKGGLGLGLSIVKSLVELHGGTVRAESAGAGTGATFTVALPASGVDVEHAKERDVQLAEALLA